MRPLHRALALALAVLTATPACAGGSDHRAPAPRPGPAEPPDGALPDVDLPSPPGAQGTVTQVTSRAAVPLQGPRVDALPGDWMLSSAGAIAVVSAKGNVVDFGPAGGRDELVALQPALSLSLAGAGADVLRIDPVEGGRALRVARAIHGQPLLLVTWVHFRGRVLHVESAAVGTGAAEPTSPGPPDAPPRLPALAVTLSEEVHWGNVPTWAEGYGFITSAGLAVTDFIARESFGVSYALCATSGRLRTRFGGQELPGFYEAALTGEDVIPVPHLGASQRRAVAIAYSTTSAGDAVLALPCTRGAGASRVALPRVPARGGRVEVARCASPDGSGGGPHPGAPPDKPAAPPGPGRPFAHFTASQAGREIELPQGCFVARLAAPGHAPGPWLDARAIASAPPESALPQAGRLRFEATERGRPVPARVLVRGLGGTPDPEWGDDADQGAAVNVAHAARGDGELPLPPGRYRVLINRGFEYTAHDEEITVTAGQTATVRAVLDRVVDTTGWIAADLHLHAEPSPDAPSRLADRIRSLAAAGVEVGVATDHNAVTDYAPTIRELGLKDIVASVIGDEVTTKDLRWGHFNVFPLAAGAAPLPWLGALPAEIFAAAHAAKPYGARTILQVNHPRMGNIGYFDVLRMDPADVPGWLRRAPLADMGFDALEVFNGDHYDRLARVEDCMRDWYALLNAGFRVVATGNSDSHKITFQEPGTPRTLVAVPRDAPGAFDERAFVDALRAGRVVVSSGPFVRLEVNGKGIGETVPEGDAEIVVRVDAPPWVEIDRIDLVRRGEPWRNFRPPPRTGPGPIEQRTRETLRKGDWVIAIARGSKQMDFLHRPGALPFGFTNPVFVR